MPTPHLDPIDHEEPLPPHLAAAPRAVTGMVRRRAWGERHVRIWWLLGLAVLGVAFYHAISGIYLWSEESRLITKGDRVEAEVMGRTGEEAPKFKHFALSANTAVDLDFTYKGKSYRFRGKLAGRTEQIYTHTMVPLFVDPEDPTHWTGRTVPGSLVHELLGAAMLAPFVVVLFVMAVWRRRRVLRIYRDGEEVLAEVVSVGHSAAAPFSRLICCAAQGGSDARMIKILLPTGKAPTVGEALWLIAPPSRPEQAIPAALFE